MNNKLFPNLVSEVILSLQDVFRDGRPLDRVILFRMKNNPKWGSRDRSFVAESTFDIVRHWRRLWRHLEEEPALDIRSLYQLFAVYWQLKGGELPAWKEFAGMKERWVPLQEKDMTRAEWFSLQDEMDELGAASLGEQEWRDELEAMNRPAPVYLRVNTIKASAYTLKKALDEAEFAFKELYENGPIRLMSKKHLNTHPLLRSGLFEIQDVGSQMIAPFLQVEPGMRVIDACAGAGGKSLHLACLMNNRGRIISMDVEPRKLEELTRRSRKDGVSIIEPRLIDSTKAIKRLAEQADRLLLDVPCSGSGVIRRNPDSKYRVNKEYVERLLKVQEDILDRYCSMLKPGGKMVYATCSLYSQENELQVQKFLAKHPEFTLEEEKYVYPSEHDSDGFFMSRLVKKK